jgi:hypothetical protein
VKARQAKTFRGRVETPEINEAAIVRSEETDAPLVQQSTHLDVRECVG